MRSTCLTPAKAVLPCPPPQAIRPLHFWRRVSLRDRLATLLAATFFFSSALADPRAPHPAPIVLYDAGHTISIAPYLQKIAPPPHDPPAPLVAPSTTTPAMSFPVRSPALSPGRLMKSVRLATPIALPHPVFLLGSDAFSVQWLRTHQSQLVRLGASGLVVEVSSLTAFRELQSLAHPVPLTPASGDDLASALQLSTYPILIHPSGEVSQ